MIERSFRKWILAIVPLAVACGASSARAGLVTYPDYATWSSAVSGGVTSVTIPDPSPNPTIFLGSGTASVTYSGVTFSTSSALSDGNFFNVGPLFTGSPAVLSSQEQSFGVPNILITLPGPVTALALDHGYGTAGASLVTFLLSNGDTVTQASTGSGYGVPDFFGATDSTPFTSVLVTGDSILDLNNVVYVSAVAVPEPSSLTLCGLGAAGMVVSMPSGGGCEKRCQEPFLDKE